MPNTLKVGWLVCGKDEWRSWSPCAHQLAPIRSWWRLPLPCGRSPKEASPTNENIHAYLRADTSCMLLAYYKKGGTGTSPPYKYRRAALPEFYGEPAVNVMKTVSPLPLFRVGKTVRKKSSGNCQGGIPSRWELSYASHC